MSKTMDTEQTARDMTSTVIAAGVTVRGDIEGQTDLNVAGSVLGGVAVTGLVLSEEAEIDGPVTAEAVVIAGRVNGAVEAKAVHIRATGRVAGDVTYASLQIEPGARVTGRLIFSDGSETAGADVVEPAPRRGGGRSELADSGQELVRMAARLRRTAE